MTTETNLSGEKTEELSSEKETTVEEESSERETISEDMPSGEVTSAEGTDKKEG